MRAVPVGVGSMVPHVTVRGNGGVRDSRRRGPACGRALGLWGAGLLVWCQRTGAVPEFPSVGGNSGTAPFRCVVCGVGQRPVPPSALGPA